MSLVHTLHLGLPSCVSHVLLFSFLATFSPSLFSTGVFSYPAPTCHSSSSVMHLRAFYTQCSFQRNPLGLLIQETLSDSLDFIYLSVEVLYTAGLSDKPRTRRATHAAAHATTQDTRTTARTHKHARQESNINPIKHPKRMKKSHGVNGELVYVCVCACVCVRV